LHPLEKNGAMNALARPHHHDAPWRKSNAANGRLANTVLTLADGSH
jgi:hypothetical protein